MKQTWVKEIMWQESKDKRGKMFEKSDLQMVFNSFGPQR